MPLKKLVAEVQRERSIVEVQRERRAGGMRVELPLPGPRREGKQVTFAHASQTEGIDARRNGWPDLQSPLGRVERVSGPTRGRFDLHFPDRCYVIFDERPDADTGEVTWHVRVQAKARELYEVGLRAWMSKWLGLWSWLLTGEWPGVRELGAHWHTTQWHINSDFVGLDLIDTDVRNMVGGRKWRRLGKTETRRELQRLGVLAHGQRYQSWVQTIEIGSRRSDTQLVVYRKGDQLREEKKVDPASSMYAPLWRTNGWRREEVTRVEFRLRKKGLVWTWPGGSIRYDLRDPARLLDVECTAVLWRRLTENRRLVLPETSTRTNTAETDPRWIAVQDAAAMPMSELRQRPREVPRLTRDERVAKGLRKLEDTARKLAVFCGNVAADSDADVGDVLVALGRRFAGGQLEEMSAVPRRARPRDVIERATEEAQFFDDEVRARQGAWCDELDRARGHRVSRRLVFDDPKGEET